jgi:hypothetical protein
MPKNSTSYDDHMTFNSYTLNMDKNYRAYLIRFKRRETRSGEKAFTQKKEKTMKTTKNTPMKRARLFVWIILLPLVLIMALLAYSPGIGASPSQQGKVELTADPGGSYLAVVNGSVQFDGSGSFDPESAPLTYAWDFGDGATGTGAMPNHRYTTIGLFDVCLTVNNGSQDSEPICTDIMVFDPSMGAISLGY